MTVSATFSPATFNIAASAGTGGTISPTGTVQVSYGGSRSFAVTPATGFGIKDVAVDGTSVGALSTVTSSNVISSHAVSASFVPLSAPPAVLNIVLSPSFLNFRDVKVGWIVSNTVKATNTGNSTLTVAAPGIGGLDAAMFNLRLAAPIALRPGGSAYVRVRFTSTSPGQKSAALKIASNDPDTPATGVLLSGTGL